MSRRLVFFILFCIVPQVVCAACPDGYTAYLGPASDSVRNANGTCSKLCAAGITSLNTSNGHRFDLFATRNTTPAIYVKSGTTTCYADLVAGAGAGTINISHNGGTYHANPDSGELCPVTYKLSFQCGDGATGTPPVAKDIGWGELFTAPYNVGTCYKAGYSHSGWKLDSTSLGLNAADDYTYTTNKTLVAQWKANSYKGMIACNDCAGVGASASISGTYASNFTPSASPSCTNPLNQTLLRYEVLNAAGESVGQTLTPGVSTTWRWPHNVRLRAIWSEPDAAPTPTTYTLSYSCGDGATGIPPASHSVVYNQLFTAPYNVGTCYKAGYSHSGWKLDSTSLGLNAADDYTYTTNKTLVAQWKANSYRGMIACNNGSNSSSYVSATYDASVTPSSTACTASSGKTFGGYRVQDAYGNDLGQTIAAGASVTWRWPYNIRLQAIWQ